MIIEDISVFQLLIYVYMDGCLYFSHALFLVQNTDSAAAGINYLQAGLAAIPGEVRRRFCVWRPEVHST